MKLTITAIAIALFVSADAQRLRSSRPMMPVNNRICDYQKNGFFFGPLRTNGPDFRSYCQSIGAESVTVNNSNFGDLTQMIVKCLGPGQKAWVNSWDGNTFGNAPLAIWTGLQPGSGSINVYIGDEPLFAICATRSNMGPTRPEPRPLINFPGPLPFEGSESLQSSAVSSSEEDAGTTTDIINYLPETTDVPEFPLDNAILDGILDAPVLAENVVADAAAEEEANDNALDSDYFLNNIENIENIEEAESNVVAENVNEVENNQVVEDSQVMNNNIAEFNEQNASMNDMEEGLVQSVIPQLFEYNFNNFDNVMN